MSEHPTVQRELRKLEELLAAFEQAGRSPGRHRAQSGRMSGQDGGMSGQDGGQRASDDGQRASDDARPDRKPDPAAACTATDFVAVLRQYRAWSGDLPWRTIAAQAKQERVHSTIYNAMRRDDLPTLEVVKAVVIGCGGGQDDLLAFTAAWQRISSATVGGHGDAPSHLPAPVPALQLQPGT
jgi:hypothetical protein